MGVAGTGHRSDVDHDRSVHARPPGAQRAVDGRRPHGGGVPRRLGAPRRRRSPRCTRPRPAASRSAEGRGAGPMTATLARQAASPPPQPSGAAPAPAPAVPPTAPGQSPLAMISIEVAATLGIALYSVVAALSFSRVFGDEVFLPDVLILVAVGHGSSLVLRLTRVPGVLAVLLTLLALVWTVGYLHYPDTYSVMLPGADTWDVATADVALVREQFRQAVAPVAYVGGWALLASIGTAFVVFAGDTLAFRANGR